jgi:nitroreductase
MAQELLSVSSLAAASHVSTRVSTKCCRGFSIQETTHRNAQKAFATMTVATTTSSNAPSQARKPAYDIAPLFLSRWSQRALTAEEIPDQVLFTAFEAARWAPSGSNTQPWRFIYAKRNSPRWADFLGLLNERNRLWAAQASALVVFVSATERNTPEGARPHRSHSFDTGAAWSAFAHQARLLGWSTRAMGGFDVAAAQPVLAVPANYRVEVIVAIGKPASADSLHESFRAAEQPTDRLPLDQLVAEGQFAF